MKQPKVIVFDLDHTLWPFESYGLLGYSQWGPFRMDKGGTIVDKHGKSVSYKDVTAILKKLKSEGYLLAIASRSSDPDGAKRLLNLFEWDKYLNFVEIYSRPKAAHLQRISRDSGIPLSEMLFFDDDQENICEVESLGVTCVLVNNGMNFQELEKGLQMFKLN